MKARNAKIETPLLNELRQSHIEAVIANDPDNRLQRSPAFRNLVKIAVQAKLAEREGKVVLFTGEAPRINHGWGSVFTDLSDC